MSHSGFLFSLWTLHNKESIIAGERGERERGGRERERGREREKEGGKEMERRKTKERQETVTIWSGWNKKEKFKLKSII